MAIRGTTRLDAGDVFPNLSFSTVGGGHVDLPDDTKRFTVLLVNRGSWCPYCTAQLKAFQSGLAKLQGEGIDVISVSTDTEAQAAELVEKNGLSFPVGYGLDAAETSEVLGTYFDPNDGPNGHPYLQSAGFIVGPDGKVVLAVTSSGPIGRLVWQDVLGMVQYLKQQA